MQAEEVGFAELNSQLNSLPEYTFLKIKEVYELDLELGKEAGIYIA